MRQLFLGTDVTSSAVVASSSSGVPPKIPSIDTSQHNAKSSPLGPIGSYASKAATHVSNTSVLNFMKEIVLTNLLEILWPTMESGIK